MNGTRNFLAGVLTTILVIALASPALGALTAKTIQVSTGAEIYVDGVKLNPADANGKPVETFIYEGTTYVPLRAVSQSLGKAVSWDGANQRVYIGEMLGQKQYLLDVCPPYQAQYLETPATITMAGNKYANGISWHTSNGYAYFNLNGQYSTLEFDIGHIDGKDMDDSTIYIYLDGQLSFSLDLTGSKLPEHYSIPLYGALQMQIQMSSSYGRCYGLGNIEIY